MILDMKLFELKCSDMADFEIVGKFTASEDALEYAKNNTDKWISCMNNVSTLPAMFFHQPDVLNPAGLVNCFDHVINSQCRY